MNRHAPALLLSSVALAALPCVGGCQIVLGLEDHRLGTLSGGAGGLSSGVGGSDGGLGGDLPVSGSSSTGGQNEGGLAGSSDVGGAGGSAAEAGAAGAATGGEGGEPAVCVLCEVGLSLVHRYSFDGTGSVATDSIDASGNGAIIGAVLDDSGDLALSGTAEYVDLPNGIVSGLTDATFEAWVTWNGPSDSSGNWHRIFDFGNNDNATEGLQGTANASATYLFLTARAGTTGPVRLAYTTAGPMQEVVVSGADPLPTGTMTQVVAVLSDTANLLTLYTDGAFTAAASQSGTLASISDINNWLGHSQFASDDDFLGSFHEFRIYNAALDTAQVQALFDAGPDATFTP